MQDHLPAHRSIGNSLFMTISFASLLISATGIGYLGDRLGLHQAFFWTAIAGFVVAPLVLLIPRASEPSSSEHAAIEGG